MDHDWFDKVTCSLRTFHVTIERLRLKSHEMSEETIDIEPRQFILLFFYLQTDKQTPLATV